MHGTPIRTLLPKQVALRKANKTKFEIRKLLDSLTTDELSFEDFKEMAETFRPVSCLQSSASTYARTRMCMRTHAHAHARACTRMHAHTPHTRTHAHTRVPARTWAACVRAQTLQWALGWA